MDMVKVCYYFISLPRPISAQYQSMIPLNAEPQVLAVYFSSKTSCHKSLHIFHLSSVLTLIISSMVLDNINLHITFAILESFIYLFIYYVFIYLLCDTIVFSMPWQPFVSNDLFCSLTSQAILVVAAEYSDICPYHFKCPVVLLYIFSYIPNSRILGMGQQFLSSVAHYRDQRKLLNSQLEFRFSCPGDRSALVSNLKIPMVS